MKREQAEDALARLARVRYDLRQLAELTPEVVADALLQKVADLDPVADALRDEVAAKAKHAKNYRVTIQHGEGTPLRSAHGGPEEAIRIAKQGYGAGAAVAEVRRASDNVVIYDGPAGIELDYRDWQMR